MNRSAKFPAPTREMTVSAIPPPHAGRLLSPKAKVICNLLVISILIPFFGGGAMLVGGAYLVLELGHIDMAEPETALGALLILLGLPIMTVSGWVGLRNPTWLGNCWFRRFARRELAERPDRIVDPDESDVVFVEIVPRENWQRLMLETATDVGFVQVDSRRRELLFEGDMERLRIPVDAIISCEREEVHMPGASSGWVLYAIVLRVRRPPNTWREIPIIPRGELRMLGGNRQRRARSDELLERIYGICRVHD